MGILYWIALALITVTAFVFSLLGFMGKGMILDHTYTNASKEEQDRMDKNAYRMQGAIIFFFLFLVSLCNLLRAVLHLAWLTYAALAFGVIGIGYAIISHYVIQKKH